MNKQSRPAGRVHFFDEWRGLAILLMVLYHGAYDLVEIFGVNWPVFNSFGMHVVQEGIAGSFIFISGVACRFSRSNRKRGLIAFGLGMVLTAVTLLVIPSQRVMFGVLHLLGAAMLVFSFLQRPLDKLHPAVGFMLMLLCFALTMYVPYGVLGFPPFAVRLPDSIYQMGVLFPLGFPASSFFSSDYFPILPWLFFFLSGSYFGVFAKQGTLPAYFYRAHLPVLSKIGRYTIWIYMLHQPVIYGVLVLIFRLLNKR